MRLAGGSPGVYAAPTFAIGSQSIRCKGYLRVTNIECGQKNRGMNFAQKKIHQSPSLIIGNLGTQWEQRWETLIVVPPCVPFLIGNLVQFHSWDNHWYIVAPYPFLWGWSCHGYVPIKKNSCMVTPYLWLSLITIDHDQPWFGHSQPLLTLINH